jgi:hypothetical protein
MKKFTVLFPLIALCLVKTTFAMDSLREEPPLDPKIVGTYLMEHSFEINLTVDKNARVKTNLTLTGPMGQIVPLSFPHHLRQTATGSYTSVGIITIRRWPGGKTKNCTFPVTVMAEFFNDGKALDLSLTYNTKLYLDSHGDCASDISQTYPMGFTKQ